MTKLPVSGLSVVDEQEATGDIAGKFDEIRRILEIPFVPNIHRAAAGAPNVLAGTWDVFRNVFLQTKLPMPLASMILFSIANAKKCLYCSAVHEVTCKTLGVDEVSLKALHEDLGSLTPERVQAIVKFAQKCALDPQSLADDDYEQVRNQGITDEELVEIIGLAALANYLDTLADAMKIEVDEVFTKVLQS